MTETTNINPRLLQGFRDFLPERKTQRDWLIEKVREVYQTFGFQPLETPVLEYADILTGKYGDEANMMMYRFRDHGDRDVAMRYDLTVPFSRVIAQYPELPNPFKRYQVAPVWRADSPQAGRYREFYQMDADIAGSDSMMADAEIIALIATLMQKLGMKNFVARISNRKILNGMIDWAGIDTANTKRVLVAIDKIDKIGADGVREELLKPASYYVSEKGETEFEITRAWADRALEILRAMDTPAETLDLFRQKFDDQLIKQAGTEKEIKLPDISNESVDKIMKFVSINGTNEEILSQLKALLSDNKIGNEGINELEEVISYIDSLGIDQTKVKIDLSIARGLDYYTGTVYETTLTDLPGFGSVFSGGRFDTLISMFIGRSVPAVGASVGIDRLFAAMEKLELLPEVKGVSQVLITAFPENRIDSLNIARTLREAGIRTEVYLGQNTSVKAQLKYADKLGVPVVILTFADQIAKGVYIVKDMLSETPRQLEVPQDELIQTVKNLIK